MRCLLLSDTDFDELMKETVFFEKYPSMPAMRAVAHTEHWNGWVWQSLEAILTCIPLANWGGVRDYGAEYVCGFYMAAVWLSSTYMSFRITPLTLAGPDQCLTLPNIFNEMANGQHYENYSSFVNDIYPSLPSLKILFHPDWFIMTG